MAYDRDGRDGRGRGRNDERGERNENDWGRPMQWQGDQGFGGGWGNQVPPQRPGEREWRRPGQESDYVRSERFSSGRESRSTTDYHGGGGFEQGGPGFDGFGDPRFDRADVSPTHSRGSGREYLIAGDPHYSEWRNRQIAQLDRDYAEYRRENQSRFDSEFGAWRGRRGEQREAVGRVREQMEVTGADGGHVGTVDKVRGERIVLTKSDPDAGGVHHSIPCGWIGHVDDKVVLNIDAKEAKKRWQDENRSRALFERERDDDGGPRVLNRSFSGTYPDEKKK